MQQKCKLQRSLTQCALLKRHPPIEPHSMPTKLPPETRTHNCYMAMLPTSQWLSEHLQMLKACWPTEMGCLNFPKGMHHSLVPPSVWYALAFPHHQAFSSSIPLALYHPTSLTFASPNFVSELNLCNKTPWFSFMDTNYLFVLAQQPERKRERERERR